MNLNYISEFVQKVNQEAFIEGNEIISCTHTEIANIQQIAEELGIYLPKSYIEFLQFGGHQIGAMFANCDVDYALCVKTLESIESGKNKPEVFRFLQTYQYQAYFDATQINNDPLIFELEYGKTYPTSQTFSTFITAKTHNYISSKSKIPIAHQKALAKLRRTLIDIQENHLQEVDHKDHFYNSLENTKSLVDSLNNYDGGKYKKISTEYPRYISALIEKSDRYCTYSNQYKSILTTIGQEIKEMAC